MIKGNGQAVLDMMLQRQIVTRNQARYSLNTDKLAELTSMTYSDFLTRNFTSEARQFIKDVLSI